MQERDWAVRANSFSRPDYLIRGVDPADAVRRNLRRILDDVAPWAGERDVLFIDVRWHPGILRGMGGAEAEITVALEGNATHFVAWIRADKSDIPAPVMWRRSGDRMEAVVAA